MCWMRFVIKQVLQMGKLFRLLCVMQDNPVSGIHR